MISLSLYTVTGLLLALALFVWRARPDSPINRSFSTFTLCIACWSLGIAALYAGGSRSFWARIIFATASLVPVTFLAFTHYYPRPGRWPTRTVLYFASVVAGACAVLSAATGLIVKDVAMSALGPTRTVGVMYAAFATYFVLTWLAGFTSLAMKLYRAKGTERAHLRYVGTAILLGAAGAITTNLVLPFMIGHSYYSWLGPYFSLPFMVLIAHAIIRHRLMDLRLVVHRSLTLTIAILVSLLPVALLLAALWPRLSAQLDADDLAALLAAVVGVSLLIPVTRDAAGRLLDRYVYRTHVNYQRTVRQASAELTRVLDLKILLPFLCRTLAGATSSEGAAVYLRHDDELRRAIGGQRHERGVFETPDTSPKVLLQALVATKDLILSDEIPRERPTPERELLYAELTRLDWALVLPLLSEDSVIGAIVVGPKLSGDPFYPQDLDLLMTLANQAGIAVRNGQLYAQVVLANEHLNNIVSTIESGVVAVDALGRVTLFNRAAGALTGLSFEALRYHPLSALPACLGDPLRQSLTDDRRYTQPEVELAGSGVTRPIMCTTSPLHDQDGAVLGAVAVFSDLTPLKELEIERRRAERLTYFEVLAAGIAHEIKNPLVAIKTFAQLVPRRLADGQFIDEFGRIAIREIARMERLLERLRTLARPAQRPRHPLDLRAPVADAIETLRPSFTEKNIVLSVAIGAAPLLVLGDHAELEQLFLNLLMNAHEATPPQGMVRIELAAGADRVTVAVVDTGAGIPPDFLERVFDPFFTTKKQGSGLGLAICASIAQAHGARLKAINRPAGGAVFTLEFPLVPAPAPVPV